MVSGRPNSLLVYRNNLIKYVNCLGSSADILQLQTNNLSPASNYLKVPTLVICWPRTFIVAYFDTLLSSSGSLRLICFDLLGEQLIVK